MSRLARICLFLALISLFPPTPASSYTPHRLQNAHIRVDGVPDEPFWQQCPVITGLIQFSPKPGEPPTSKTEVRIAYDSHNLYIFSHLHEPDPSLIIAHLTRRDRSVEADNFQVDIDSYHDRRNGYHFELNAGGTLRDGTLGNDSESISSSWDAVWQGAAGRFDEGWTAEMAIPWSCLRFGPGPSHTMGINIKRNLAGRREQASLTDVSPGQVGYVSRFLVLENISGINTGRPLVQLPYLSLRNPDLNSTSGLDALTYGAGLDMAYGWRNGMVVNATINPDFGQVEADRALIDLSGFETRFPEKRPFFLEGAGIFSTPYSLFYSRRIGRHPGRPSVPTGGELKDEPDNTSILGAAKLTGKTAGGLQYGAIAALTGREQALVADSLGHETRPLVEPPAVYQVLRLKQDVLSRSSVGIMSAGRHYLDGDQSLNTGLDWSLELPHPDYRISGQAVGSRITGDGWGWGARTNLKKEAGEYITAELYGHFERPELNLNPAGFFSKPGRKGVSAQTTGKLQPNQYTLRQVSLNIMHERNWNFNNVLLDDRLDIRLTPEFEMGRVNMGYNRDFKTYNDHHSPYGNLVGVLPTHEVWSWISPELGGRADLTIKLEYRPAGEGKSWRRYGFSGAVRPLTRWDISVDTKWARIKEPHFYVAGDTTVSGTAADIVGDKHEATWDLVTRSTFLFTNRLSLQFYNQLFTGNIRFSNYQRLTGPFMVTDMSGVIYSDDPHFTRTVCNSNLTLRWEFRPGSSLYLVWSAAFDHKTAFSDNNLLENFERIAISGVKNSFLAKIDYLFTINTY